MSDSIFPHIKKAVSDFVSDQEGNIPRNKVLMIGSMVLILGLLLSEDALAHTSHSSHSSHKSHSSHSSGAGSHSSHVSHQSHTSHSSSSGHSSHSSSIHSNSTHSSAAVVTVPVATPTPTPVPVHENVAPTLEYLNAIQVPADAAVDMASRLGLVAEGMTPPDTVALDMAAPSVAEPSADAVVTSPPMEVSQSE